MWKNRARIQSKHRIDRSTYRARSVIHPVRTRRCRCICHPDMAITTNRHASLNRRAAADLRVRPITQPLLVVLAAVVVAVAIRGHPRYAPCDMRFTNRSFIDLCCVHSDRPPNANTTELAAVDRVVVVVAVIPLTHSSTIQRRRPRNPMIAIAICRVCETLWCCSFVADSLRRASSVASATLYVANMSDQTDENEIRKYVCCPGPIDRSPHAD